jgi:hypothetical protein
MYIGKTLFAQIMDCIPSTSFGRIVARYRGNARVRSLPCTEQFRVLVGVLGFEPATPSSRTRCATRPRHSDFPSKPRWPGSRAVWGSGLLAPRSTDTGVGKEERAVPTSVHPSSALRSALFDEKIVEKSSE